MDKNVSTLIEKYLKGECTPEERSTLLAHYNRYLDQDLDTLSLEDIERLHKNTWEAICKQTIPSAPQRATVPTLRKWLPYAAAILLFVLAGVFVVKRQYIDALIGEVGYKEDILPIGDRAILTLADGRRIDLDTSQTGIVFSDNTITYQDGSSVHGGDMSATAYQLSTPKGATYHIILPDGTRVWLNGGSEIRYPGRFDTDKRVVELEGEAYFAVEKQNGVPFLVVTKEQEIKVLGTEFNVSSYETAVVKTTLVEGSVQVTVPSGSHTPLLLSPGEQAVLLPNGVLNKKKANLKQELAWRSGVFYFDKTPVADMMLQVAHWYDVEIRYEGGIPRGTFSGIMDRNVSLLTLLEFLEESSTQFNFDLQGRILVVRPKK